MKTSDYDGIKENFWCIMIYKNILCNVQDINLKCIYLLREMDGGERERGGERGREEREGRERERERERGGGRERERERRAA